MAQACDCARQFVTRLTCVNQAAFPRSRGSPWAHLGLNIPAKRRFLDLRAARECAARARSPSDRIAAYGLVAQIRTLVSNSKRLVNAAHRVDCRFNGRNGFVQIPDPVAQYRGPVGVRTCVTEPASRRVVVVRNLTRSCARKSGSGRGHSSLAHRWRFRHRLPARSSRGSGRLAGDFVSVRSGRPHRRPVPTTARGTFPNGWRATTKVS
jgi:hypothetical protein